MFRDKNLTSSICINDEISFQEFFQQWYGKLYAYLLKLVKSKDIADELTTDIFLKIWRDKEDIPVIQNADAYLFRVAHNKAIDFFRKTSRDAQVQKIIAKQIQTDQAPSADHFVLEAENEQLFRKAIECLSPQRRDIFLLSRVNGLTHEQIADKMNLSRNTVRNTIAESLKNIRQFLGSNTVGIIITLSALLLQK